MVKCRQETPDLAPRSGQRPNDAAKVRKHDWQHRDTRDIPSHLRWSPTDMLVRFRARRTDTSAQGAIKGQDFGCARIRETQFSHHDQDLSRPVRGLVTARRDIGGATTNGCHGQR